MKRGLSTTFGWEDAAGLEAEAGTPSPLEGVLCCLPEQADNIRAPTNRQLIPKMRNLFNEFFIITSIQL